MISNKNNDSNYGNYVRSWGYALLLEHAIDIQSRALFWFCVFLATVKANNFWENIFRPSAVGFEIDTVR